jgi:hypothetical protein
MLIDDSSEGVGEIQVRFSEDTGGQMGKGGHCTGRRLYIFVWTGEWDHQLGTGFFVHKKIVSAVRRVDFSSDRM